MKETLKALREKNNYSQATVAKYLGISRQMYIKYESGEAEPPVKVIVALIKLYVEDFAKFKSFIHFWHCIISFPFRNSLTAHIQFF